MKTNITLKSETIPVFLPVLFALAALFALSGCSDSSGDDDDDDDTVSDGDQQPDEDGDEEGDEPSPDGDEDGDGPSCPAGSLNCPCDDGSCDAGLVCMQDYCVPSVCDDGTQGCACHDDGTCNESLTCENGTCVDASCPAGAEGCACLEGNQCNDGLVCQNDLCIREGCVDGTEGCPCDNGNCDEGLVCNESDLCERASLTGGLVVENSDVRACDVLVDLGSSGADYVRFSDGVMGRFRRVDTRMALSFIGVANTAMPAPIARFYDAHNQEISAASLTLSSVRCADLRGAVVSSPQASLQE